MNKSTVLTVTLAFAIGVTLGSLQMSEAFWNDETSQTDEPFTKGNAVNNEERPHGLMRYFSDGDPMNECLWDVVAVETCQRGILFDNQENMNKKLNWLLEKNGYDFGQ